MKKHAFLLMAILTILLAGCLDTVEELNIAVDGTGTYKTTMDMSGMFDMIEMMAAMDTSASGQLKKLSEKDMDSVLHLRSITDSAADLTEEQKRLFREATMRITMNQKEKQFKLGMTYPFKNIEDVQKIIALNESGKGVGLFGKGQKDSTAVPGMDEKSSVPSLNNYFDITIRPGLIERRLNEVKIESLKKDEKFAEMKNAGEMMGTITFKTVIHLHKPAKKAEGEKLTLSDDKKTVTIKSNLGDLFDNPKSLGYKIEY
jgi:hypothetical protein